MPALVSAPAEKSFSKASCPILACNSFRSTVGADADADSAPNVLAARSINWFVQPTIWFACTSCTLANSANVFSPRIASNATLALNSGEWFLRALLLMGFLLSRASGPGCCRRVSTYRRVRICEATSIPNGHRARDICGREMAIRKWVAVLIQRSASPSQRSLAASCPTFFTGERRYSSTERCP